MIVAQSCPLAMGTHMERDCKEKGLEGDKPNGDVWELRGIVKGNLSPICNILIFYKMKNQLMYFLSN